MRGVWGFLLVMLLASVIGQVGAQDNTPTAPTGIPSQSLRDVVIEYNICPKDLLNANRFFLSAETIRIIEESSPRDVPWAELPDPILIPPHRDCYYIVPAILPALPSVEVAYNICIEDFYGNSLTPRGISHQETVFWYLWRDAPPCVNGGRQRLQYLGPYDRMWETVEYTQMPFVAITTSFEDLGVCLNDLVAANPLIRFGQYGDGIPYIGGNGMRLFVPADATPCQVFRPEQGQTLYEVSQRSNVCAETIAEASNLKYGNSSHPAYYVPLDEPPCYDAEGYRLGMTLRTMYTTLPTDSLLDVALKYEVCLNDLWDANPVMTDRVSSNYLFLGRLPNEIFIPATPPCADPMRYTLPLSQTVYQISGLTNVCMNRLAETNSNITAYWGHYIAMGETITIPQRPHCYNFERGGLQTHVCYPIPVTADMDLTGHEPPISWVHDTDLPYCYQLTDGMTAFYENKPYTLYADYGSVLMSLECFGVDDAYVIRMQYGELYRWSEYGKRFNGNWLMIPQPHADCPLLHMDRKMRRERTDDYQYGTLYNGIYRVSRDDTLVGIGRAFGYLPEWIAQANNLSEPYMIYEWQELRMPPYPSLYTLIPVGGAAGVIVLVSGAIYGLRRWRHRRYSSKKKNS